MCDCPIGSCPLAPPGGVLMRAGTDGAVIDPRLCGNWSGLGRECVRSNKPHLLHNYKKQIKCQWM